VSRPLRDLGPRAFGLSSLALRRASPWARAVTIHLDVRPPLVLSSRPMRTDIPLRCRCGALRGVIADYTPSENNRVVCYCDDCQAFARWLGRDDLLDPHGGSDIVQVAPSRLRFTQGADQLRCMRLSGKGIHRWYAACCRQPAGNTLPSARSPFVGLVSAIVERPEGRALDDVIGPSFGGIHGRLATGGRPPGVPDRVSFKILWRSVRPLLANLVAGRHRPSPFVDPATGGFVSPPQVLSTAERDALRPR